MTTLIPIKKSEEYVTDSLDEAAELVRDALRQSTFKFVSVRKMFPLYEQKDKWEITISHEHARH
jgi:hypothetical protein